LAEKYDDAAKLLQLLAFLNPDGILRDSLEAGSDGLTGDIHVIVADSNKLDNALSSLERLSLITRQIGSTQQKIAIHRLVQFTIKDELQADEFTNMEI
jgi:hypothetical protein